MRATISTELLVWPTLHEELAPFLKYCRGLVLNAGAGQREVRLGDRDLNIDIVPSSRPHVIADLHRIPLLDESVDTVVSIAVLEHVRYPWLVAEEFYRVLRPAGHGVICVPFLQPRHACPNDFMRFTEDGLADLMRYVGFEVLETAPVHHFGQTLAWLLCEYLQHNRPHRLAEPLWAAAVKRLSRGQWLGGDSPNTHNTHYVVVRRPGEATAPPPHYLEALASKDPRSWFMPLLACPHTGQSLRLTGESLVSEDGRFTYGFSDGIPDLLPKSGALELNVARAPRSLEAVRSNGGPRPLLSSGSPAASPSRDRVRWASAGPSEKSFGVTFKTQHLQRLQQARPTRVAVLVTSEYEGMFHNGGIGTYYRRLSEQLTADGWHVVLLLTFTDKGFGGESEWNGVKHIYSTSEVEQALNLQPVHIGMLSAQGRDANHLQSVRTLLFVQAVGNCFRESTMYVEFPEMMGSGHHTVQACRSGLLGHRCVTAVTLHSGHEWIYEANEKHNVAQPSPLWAVAECERISFEQADLSFYPSEFLRAKVESYGWDTTRAVHMPNLVPTVSPRVSADGALPELDPAKVPVVFFGRLEERKGLCTFVEAVRALPPAVRRRVHVLFLGKVVRLYSAPLAHLDSREYIEQALPPEVSYSIVSELYSAEALGYVRGLRGPVVCLTSPQENFPNTGLEMGQVPVKLVVSDTGGFRETLGLVQRAAGVHWFAPKNAVALAGALRRAIEDEGEVEAGLGPEGIERTNRALLARKEVLIEQAFARAAAVHVQRPRVSVGVLWGGQASGLLDCLASIEAQSYGDLDVIVVDGGGDDGAAREALEHARTLFPQYRVVRPAEGLSAGAAWNHAVELAEGEYFVGVEAGTVLAPFAVAQLVKAAGNAGAGIVTCPGRVRGAGDEIPGFMGGPLPRLMETALREGTCFLGAVRILRRFRRLEDHDVLTHGWEVLAAVLVTGGRMAHYPYPLYEAEAAGTALDEAGRVKQQYQLRQYVAQIPQGEWSKRQLALLLMATQQLQAQVAAPREGVAAPSEPAPTAPLVDGLRELEAVRTTLEQVRVDLQQARNRILAMERTKFWALRGQWFRVRRTLGIPGHE